MAHVAKHGIPFGIASGVFADDRRLEREDKRPNAYGERRWTVVGLVDGVHLHVTFAMEGEAAWIISARSASRKERTAYDAR